MGPEESETSINIAGALVASEESEDSINNSGVLLGPQGKNIETQGHGPSSPCPCVTLTLSYRVAQMKLVIVKFRNTGLVPCA